MLKKFIFIIAFSLFSVSITFSSDSHKTEQINSVLSELRITSCYTNGFNLYNMDKYSKNSIGAALGFEFTILPEIASNFDLGFYGRAAFQNFIPYSIQLLKLYSYSFSGGFYGQWNLPSDISLLLSAGAGFLISDLDFLSAEKGNINDIYYDFMIEADFSVRKAIIKTKKINLLGSAGCHTAFYNEKTENFMNIGPAFGLTIDFKPINSKHADKNE